MFNKSLCLQVSAVHWWTEITGKFGVSEKLWWWWWKPQCTDYKIKIYPNCLQLGSKIGVRDGLMDPDGECHEERKIYSFDVSILQTREVYLSFNSQKSVVSLTHWIFLFAACFYKTNLKAKACTIQIVQVCFSVVVRTPFTSGAHLNLKTSPWICSSSLGTWPWLTSTQRWHWLRSWTGMSPTSASPWLPMDHWWPRQSEPGAAASHRWGLVVLVAVYEPTSS